MRAPAPLRLALRVLLAGMGAVFAALLVVGLAYLLRTGVDLVWDMYRTSRFIGMNAPKALAIAAVALVLLAATPLAIADGVSSARFRRAERDLRERRPQDAVSPYDGPEGTGLAFDGTDGRVLLLKAPGGLGRPRVVTLPPSPDAPAHPAEAALGG